MIKMPAHAHANRYTHTHTTHTPPQVGPQLKRQHNLLPICGTETGLLEKLALARKAAAPDAFPPEASAAHGPGIFYIQAQDGICSQVPVHTAFPSPRE